MVARCVGVGDSLSRLLTIWAGAEQALHNSGLFSVFYSDMLRDTVGDLKAETIPEKLFKFSGQNNLWSSHLDVRSTEVLKRLRKKTYQDFRTLSAECDKSWVWWTLILPASLSVFCLFPPSCCCQQGKEFPESTFLLRTPTFTMMF